MEAEYQKLKAIPSFKFKIDTSIGSESDENPRIQKLRAVSSFKHLISRQGSSDIDVLPRYQSLKDVMAASVSPRAGADTEISIRNELVKHAASAYVLSATIISPPNRDDGDSRMFERIKICCLGFLSCWQIHVGLPLVDFLYQLLHGVTNGLRGSW